MRIMENVFVQHVKGAHLATRLSGGAYSLTIINLCADYERG